MHLRLLSLLFLLALSGTLIAQDGIIGQGFSTGFNNPGDITSFTTSVNGTQKYVTTSSATGPQFFRLANGNSERGPNPCTGDVDWSNSEGFSYDNMNLNCGFAFRIDVDNLTDVYIFKTPGAAENDFLYFKFSAAVPTFNPVFSARLPDDPVVNSTQTVSFTAGLNDPLPTGGAVYMRYTIDGFATSTVIKMTVIDGSNDQFFVADVPPPANNEGQTFTYYFFLSGDDNNVGPQANGSDADYRTIEIENNAGANYSFVYSDPAPVTYRSFGGERNRADVVDLRWTTATEFNAHYFALECSEDNGRSWNERDRIVADNSPEGSAYSYLDRGAPAGSLQYRLRQVDFDGSFAYSPVIGIAALPRATATTVYPNPFRGQFTLNASGNTTSARNYRITDLHGKTFQDGRFSEASQRIDTPTLPAGVYLLQIFEGGKFTESRRIVKF